MASTRTASLWLLLCRTIPPHTSTCSSYAVKFNPLSSFQAPLSASPFSSSSSSSSSSASSYAQNLPRQGSSSSHSGHQRCRKSSYFNSGSCESSSLMPVHEDKQLKLALDHLEQGKIQLGYFAFVNLLQVCSRLRNLALGKRLHAQLAENGFTSDRYLSNLLIGMYSKCGSLRDALRIFDNMAKRNAVSWNIMITAFSEHGLGEEALKLFGEMERAGIRPSKVTLISCLNACCSQETLAEGLRIHKLAIESAYESDVVVGTAIAKMYGKFGSLKEARSVFDKLPHRNVISWNTLIAGYAQHGHADDVVKLIDQMEREGVKPDQVTFITALNAFSGKQSLPEAELIHSHIVSSAFESDVAVGNALLNMYSKCGARAKLQLMFSQMPKRDIISWNSAIAAFVEEPQVALSLLASLQWNNVKLDTVTFVNMLNAFSSPAALEEGKMMHFSIIACGFEIEIVLGNALISMYGKCGSPEDAFWVFSKMLQQDVVSWNGILGAYAQNGFGRKALELFQHMQKEGVKPDRITFVIMADCCAGMRALGQGRMMHKKIMDYNFKGDVVIGTALVNMYGESGCLEDAKAAFDAISGRNVATWNAMISSYAQHGYGREALQLFREMQEEQVKPDKITFVGVLSACSHGGLVDEGRCFFHLLKKEYGLLPTTEHYGCMVDLFGRAGHLEEAEDLLSNMPLDPNEVLWLTLLGACRKHGDVERGKRAAQHILKMNPHNDAAKIALSNIFAAAERWDDTADVKGRMLIAL